MLYFFLPRPLSIRLKLSELFALLEQLRQQRLVEDYSLSQTTLEEIFMYESSPSPFNLPCLFTYLLPLFSFSFCSLSLSLSLLFALCPLPLFLPFP